MINIKEVLEAMKSVLLLAFNQSLLPNVTLAVKGYIEDAEQRLTNLANGAITGELKYSFVVERLKEEATNIKDHLLSVTQIVGAEVQDFANRAVTIFENSLKDAIGQLEENKV